jgi:hypothetical protein
MKKRKTLIISLLLVAALCLGIGYAAVTDTLTINGSASLNGAKLEEEFDGDVYFDGISGNTDKASQSKLDGEKVDTATFKVVGLEKINEEVSVTYTIQNDYANSVWVSLKEAPQNAANEYIEITHDLVDGTEITAGGTTTVTVTAKVIKAANTNIELSNYKLNLVVADENPNP